MRTCIESYPDAVRHRCRLERPPEGPGPRRRRYHFLETSQEKDASGYKDKREELRSGAPAEKSPSVRNKRGAVVMAPADSPCRTPPPTQKRHSQKLLSYRPATCLVSPNAAPHCYRDSSPPAGGIAPPHSPDGRQVQAGRRMSQVGTSPTISGRTSRALSRSKVTCSPYLKSTTRRMGRGFKRSACCAASAANARFPFPPTASGSFPPNVGRLRTRAIGYQAGHLQKPLVKMALMRTQSTRNCRSAKSHRAGTRNHPQRGWFAF